MAIDKGVTFTIKEVETFPIKVEMAIPPVGKPEMQGVITVRCNIKNKDEVKSLAEEQLSDSDYFDRIVIGIEGMGRKEGDNVRLLSSEEAIDEVKNGRYNMYFLNSIITAYFEQFGEARRKNSSSSSKR